MTDAYLARAAELLPRVLELMHARPPSAAGRHGADGSCRLTFARAGDVSKALSDAMLNSALDSCEEPFERVLHAVAWHDAPLVKAQLQLIDAKDLGGKLAVALEKARDGR